MHYDIFSRPHNFSGIILDDPQFSKLRIQPSKAGENSPPAKFSSIKILLRSLAGRTYHPNLIKTHIIFLPEASAILPQMRAEI
jgi:hypothetical protein